MTKEWLFQHTTQYHFISLLDISSILLEFLARSFIECNQVGWCIITGWCDFFWQICSVYDNFCLYVCICIALDILLSISASRNHSIDAHSSGKLNFRSMVEKHILCLINTRHTIWEWHFTLMHVFSLSFSSWKILPHACDGISPHIVYWLMQYVICVYYYFICILYIMCILQFPNINMNPLFLYLFRHVVVKEDLSEFLNDGSWRRGYNVNRYLAIVILH